MESVRNPFFHWGPIRQRDYFFDRRHEVGQALGLLRSLQNVAQVGQRRIGKTSLLYQLADPAIHSDHGLLPAKYVFVYLNGEELTELSDECESQGPDPRDDWREYADIQYNEGKINAALSH